MACMMYWYKKTSLTFWAARVSIVNIRQTHFDGLIQGKYLPRESSALFFARETAPSLRSLRVCWLSGKLLKHSLAGG